MSFAIETESVSEVLLADDWHEVAEKTFEVDAESFRFVESSNRTVLVGPRTSILALRYGRRGPAFAGGVRNVSF